MFGVSLAPLPRASRIARRHGAQGAALLAIFFAFADHHRLGREHFGKPVENATGTVQIPVPAALAIGPELLKVLRLVAHDLKEQLAVFVLIVVLSHDSSRGSVIAEKLAQFDPRLLADGFRSAPREAFQKDFPLALVD